VANVKQFGGFFKIFWEIFKNYRVIIKIENNKIIGRGAAPTNSPMAAKPPKASGVALAKPLVTNIVTNYLKQFMNSDCKNMKT